VAPPRCAELEGVCSGSEEEAGNKSSERSKRARGRPVWRRIVLYALLLDSDQYVLLDLVTLKLSAAQ
jgi:hypothetical protein